VPIHRKIDFNEIDGLISTKVPQSIKSDFTSIFQPSKLIDTSKAKELTLQQLKKNEEILKKTKSKKSKDDYKNERIDAWLKEQSAIFGDEDDDEEFECQTLKQNIEKLRRFDDVKANQWILDQEEIAVKRYEEDNRQFKGKFEDWMKNQARVFAQRRMEDSESLAASFNLLEELNRKKNLPRLIGTPQLVIGDSSEEIQVLDLTDSKEDEKVASKSKRKLKLAIKNGSSDNSSSSVVVLEKDQETTEQSGEKPQTGKSWWKKILDSVTNKNSSSKPSKYQDVRTF
jgi:hypothetical protein